MEGGSGTVAHFNASMQQSHPCSPLGLSIGMTLRWSCLPAREILVSPSLLSFLVSLLGSGEALQTWNKTPLMGGPSLIHSGPFPLPGSGVDGVRRDGFGAAGLKAPLRV